MGKNKSKKNADKTTEATKLKVVKVEDEETKEALAKIEAKKKAYYDYLSNTVVYGTPSTPHDQEEARKEMDIILKCAGSKDTKKQNPNHKTITPESTEPKKEEENFEKISTEENEETRTQDQLEKLFLTDEMIADTKALLDAVKFEKYGNDGATEGKIEFGLTAAEMLQSNHLKNYAWSVTDNPALRLDPVDTISKSGMDAMVTRMISGMGTGSLEMSPMKRSLYKPTDMP